MFVWYLTFKSGRKEKQSANYLICCRKAANLFTNPSITQIEPDAARSRIAKINIQQDALELNNNELSDAIFSVLRNVLMTSGNSTQSENIIFNIEQLIKRDPLFNNEKNAEHFIKEVKEIKQRLKWIALAVDTLRVDIKPQATGSRAAEFTLSSHT